MTKKTNKNKKTDKKIDEDKILIYGIIFLVALILVSFSIYKLFFGTPIILTLEELHQLNLEGKLKPDEGYMYGPYSFVNYSYQWQTQIYNSFQKIQYNVQLRYGPREVPDVVVGGNPFKLLIDAIKLNTTYLAFDPSSEGLQYIALAASDMTQALNSVYRVLPTASCSKNETWACANRPIVDCDSTDLPIILLINKEPTAVAQIDNCLVIQGKDFELVKSVDKVLLLWFGVMQQEGIGLPSNSVNTETKA